MKYKITIRRTLTEDYEMTLENDKCMAAFDEARKLVAARNETSKIGHFAVIKIEEVKEEKNETSDNVSQVELHPEPRAGREGDCCG